MASLSEFYGRSLLRSMLETTLFKAWVDSEAMAEAEVDSRR